MESTKIISKTQQYRKVMKPMLERKRRARINKCLDQLKELIIECMKEDDEHILKLEKADILEHTVEYLHKIRKNEKKNAITTTPTVQQKQNSNINEEIDIKESFRNGYVHAANEISKILASTRGVTPNFGIQLMTHLGHKLNTLVTISTPLELDTINKNQHQQPFHSFDEIQQSHYYNQQSQSRSYSPMSVNVSQLSPVSSGYHSNLSSPVPSEDSSLSSIDLNIYQNHINNKNNYLINSNKENVWRPW